MRDYIEREAAMAAACKALCHPGVLCPDFKCAEVRDAFNAIPAADVRPVVKSKWADNHVSFYRGCPECGAFVRANLDEVFLRDFPSAVGRLNFCPNCGAEMEAGE